jgi:cytochrome P450/NADPH-cytochrome P450 reductase
LRDDSERKATKRSAAASVVATPAASPAVAAHGTPLLVLFGSNLGTSEEFARQIAEAGERNGFHVDACGARRLCGTAAQGGRARDRHRLV